MSQRLALVIAVVTAFVSMACSPQANGGSISHTGVCIHLGNPYSEYDCPELSFQAASVLPLQGAASMAPASNIESITIEVKYKGGHVERATLPEHTDAIFFGKRVSDSLLAYYYDQKGEATKASGVREKTKGWPYP